MAQDGKKKKSEVRFLNVSAEESLDTPVKEGNTSMIGPQESALTALLQHMQMQDQHREVRERADRDEREKRDREWMMKMEERDAEKRKEEFAREERRQLMMEQMGKDREIAEEVRRREEEEWRVLAGERERTATLAQQKEMRLANTVMHELHAQQQAYAALLGRLPRFEGKKMPLAFIQSLEKQLCDHEIPERKWLSALESCLDGSASTAYWTLVAEQDRQDYEHAKQAVLRCLGPASVRRLDQVGNCRWPKDESVAEVWEESVQHVKSFLAGGETGEQVAFKWMLTRTLAKCMRECADAVWKAQLKSVPEAVEAMRDWEHKYGHPAKVWKRMFESRSEKKVDGARSRRNLD